MRRLFLCLLAFAVLVVGVTALQPRLDPVDRAEARTASNCPTKALRAQYARCFIDRGAANNYWRGSSRKEYFSTGGGRNTVVAGGGDDVIVGGPGVDIISPGAGYDRVFVKGGGRDTVVCNGRGRTTVFADPSDSVSSSCAKTRR